MQNFDISTYIFETGNWERIYCTLQYHNFALFSILKLSDFSAVQWFDTFCINLVEFVAMEGTSSSLGPVGHVCSLCSCSFDSRNKLFKHVKVCSTGSQVLRNSHANTSKSTDTGRDTYLYVMGGRLRGRTLRSVERFSFEKQLWEECPPMLENRGSHGAASVGGVLYSIGGGGFRSNLSSCEAYELTSTKSSDSVDSETDGVWKCVAPLECSRHALAVVSTSNGAAVYAVGGWVDGKECSSVVERYNPATNQWTTVAPLNQSRRLHGVASHPHANDDSSSSSSADALLSSDRLYAFGGNCDDPQWHTSTAEVYDPVSNQWSYIAPMPAAGGAAAASVLPYVFVFLNGKYVLRYDPVANDYVRLSALPLQEWHCFDVSAVPGTPFVYVLGGVTNGRWCKSLYRYDASNDTWLKMPSMMHARRRCASAIVVHSTDSTENTKKQKTEV